ncbi:MAG: sporulation peptidase YabG [Bacillota bacterium]
MGLFQKGDVVARRSHKMDVMFKIIDLHERDGKEHALLKGIDFRLLCDSPTDDLVKIKHEDISAYWRKIYSRNNEIIRRSLSRRDNNIQLMRAGGGVEPFAVPGTVLHIDGDPDYLELCLTTYKQLGVSASGYVLPEEKHARSLEELLPKHLPDILVLTGHDGFMPGSHDYKDIKSYRNSNYYVSAVKTARLFEHNRDSLVIFAGACQSHYEAILKAGANFASSPQRVLIHAFDPVFIVEKVAYTPVSQQVRVKEAIEHTITSYPGIGGVETRGCFRQGVPKSPY